MFLHVFVSKTSRIQAIGERRFIRKGCRINREDTGAAVDAIDLLTISMKQTTTNLSGNARRHFRCTIINKNNKHRDNPCHRSSRILRKDMLPATDQIACKRRNSSNNNNTAIIILTPLCIPHNIHRIMQQQALREICCPNDRPVRARSLGTMKHHKLPNTMPPRCATWKYLPWISLMQ